MILNLGSLAFNASIDSGGGTPAWGTELGQGEGYKFVFEDMSDFFTGMVYRSVSDMDNVTCPLGKGGNQRADYDFVIASLFDKVFVNGKRVVDARFLLLVVKKLQGDHHVGRRTIKYNPRMTYRGEYINEDCYKKMTFTLGLPENAAWFVYEIFIVNQDELHFTAFELGEKPQSYRDTEERKKAFINRLPKEGNHLYKLSTQLDSPLQQIYYGAPGTGKSHKVKELTGKDNVVRTTFHPDSDYSSFVGCYKPTSIEVPMRDVTGKVIVENGQKVTENRIVYEFVEQAFLKAYIKAWKMYAEDENNPKKQYLVIEEINRGNCAQIFGDLFQLLDRGANGFSEYPIDADKDMQKHLAKAFQDMAYLEAPAIGEMSAEETARAIRNGEKLILPSNLYIWATMNTSDQSLFPIDSAFKRRWDWQYVPIHDGRKGWQIEADGKRYDWWQFVDAMNDKIGAATYSEDKKLGYFFCKAKDGAIDAETFVGKVVFYIWNDVFKDFAEEAGNLFKDVDGSMLSFNKFYTIGTDGKRMVVEPKIAILMQNLGVEPITTSNSTNDDEPEEDEDGNNPSSYNKNYDKFSVNGEGKWGKNRLPYECLKKYVEMNPGLNADEVLNNWKSLNVNVPHFVESKEEYESRTDNSKRSYYVKCGDTIIYVAHNGYGSNGKVYEFIDAINNANWGIKLAKVMA